MYIATSIYPELTEFSPILVLINWKNEFTEKLVSIEEAMLGGRVLVTGVNPDGTAHRHDKDLTC